MTKGELISQVKNQLKLLNVDSRVNSRFIWSLIDKQLRWLIKRENTKFNLMEMQDIFQTYKCIEVEEAPAIDECCGIKSKCTVFRTKCKLPDIYEDNSGVIIKSIYTIDGSMDFSPIQIPEYMRKLENPTTRKYDKGRYYFYNSGYIYFPGTRVKKVMVKAYFIDEIFNDCEVSCAEDERCKSVSDQKIRVPNYILSELMDFVIKEIAGITLKIQSDEAINKNENRKN